MIELVDQLTALGVPVGVLSNSEGKLAELIDEIGWSGRFRVVADSGRLGIEKPDPAIFQWTAAQLGVAVGEVAHVGDSLAADVEGALNAGMRAVWFRGRGQQATPPDARAAHDADGVRAALRAWGLQGI
jgi:putative hydrolase of the HAD superfamily